MVRSNKKQLEMVLPDNRPFRISQDVGSIGFKVKEHCSTLFVVTSTVDNKERDPIKTVINKPVVSRSRSFKRGVIDIAPKGEGAVMAFNRDLDNMLAELDHISDTWDE